jgi:hypothetical protein
MLQKYIKDHKQLPGIINTFGFGYNLDSKLLDEIAILGNGSYCFIPDASFVGTIFINSLANFLTCFGRNCILNLKIIDEKLKFAKNLPAIGYPIEHEGKEITINIGQLVFGKH